MSQLYSKAHIEQQKEIHRRRPEYGAAGHLFAKTIVDIASSLNTKDVLDYGAGKRALEKSVPVLAIKSYDPAVDGIDMTPDPADVVVCTHVLPYCEPEYLDAILDDLTRLTKRALVLVVKTSASDKLLEDGKSVTKIVKPYMEWINIVAERMQLFTYNQTADDEFLAVWTKSF